VEVLRVVLLVESISNRMEGSEFCGEIMFVQFELGSHALTGEAEFSQNLDGYGHDEAIFLEVDFQEVDEGFKLLLFMSIVLMIKLEASD